MKYLHENSINGYIPDNKFRQRDPKANNQKENHSRRQPITGKRKKASRVISASEFDFNSANKPCVCPANENRWLPSELIDRLGHGRQVPFIIEKGQRAPNYTDWMKHRVDSDKGKLIYSHRMSVMEPVFGSIGSNKGLSRFSLRAKKKVQGQCDSTVYCII